MNEHVQTAHYFDEATGEPYAPETPPVLDDPEGDSDSE